MKKYYDNFLRFRISKIIVPMLLSLYLLVTSYVYYQRIGSFSFGDEWHNFAVGYFLERGRMLHGEIFHNHQMLAPYVSAIIQKIFHPTSLYHLVLYHRLFIIIFSLCMNVLLFLRFGKRSVIFILLFEALKFYYFGNLFLPETLVTYPLVYLFGLSFLAVKKNELTKTDLIFGAFLSWFVVFNREPYAPLALLLYTTLLFYNKRKTALYSFGIFLTLSLLALVLVRNSLSDYFYQVITFNLTYMIPKETGSVGGIPGILKGTLYPLTILIDGNKSYFHLVLLLLDCLFLLFALQIFFVKKNIRFIIFLFLALAFAGVRFVVPGKTFFETFHMLPWIGIFIFSVSLLFFEEYGKYVRLAKFILISLSIVVIFLPSKSFLYEKVNRLEEFTINYAHYESVGGAIRLLSKPGDTLFADEWDYIIYWQSGIDSSYKYAIYTFATNADPLFREAREEMFKKNLPTFYYTNCKLAHVLQSIHKEYISLFRNNLPTCIFVKKSKISNISAEVLDRLGKLGYTVPLQTESNPL